MSVAKLSWVSLKLFCYLIQTLVNIIKKQWRAFFAMLFIENQLTLCEFLPMKFVQIQFNCATSSRWYLLLLLLQASIVFLLNCCQFNIIDDPNLIKCMFHLIGNFILSNIFELNIWKFSIWKISFAVIIWLVSN